MENYIIELLEEQRKSIRLMEEQNGYIKQLVSLMTTYQRYSLQKDLLDSADVKTVLKIGDTKFYQLKKERVFPFYRLHGKDYCFEQEIVQAIRKSKTR